MNSQQEHLESILTSCRGRIQEEVSTLIGKEFRLGQPRFLLAGRREILARFSGRQVFVRISISGEIEGEGWLIMGLRDAISIGGTLIMLPAQELESVVDQEEYSEELKDSFNEVANIICGTVTLIFEQQYPKKPRFIRMEQEIADLSEDEGEGTPIADEAYEAMILTTTIGDKELGPLALLIPGSPFDLVPAEAGPEAVSVEARQSSSGREEEKVGILRREAAAGETKDALLRHPGGDFGDAAERETEASAQAQARLEQKRRAIDELLRLSLLKSAGEAGTLLGGTLEIEPLGFEFLSGEDFLTNMREQQVMTRMEILGREGAEALVFAGLETAIRLGGALIMLPESQVEELVAQASFTEDISEAYGEICNTVANAYTAVFDEQYQGRLGLKKTSMEQIGPEALPDAAVFPSTRPWYLSAGRMRYNGRELGSLRVLIPASALGLEDLLPAGEEEAAAKPARGQMPGNEREAVGEAGSHEAEDMETADILIVTDDEDEGQRIAKVLDGMGYTSRLARFRDSVQQILSARMRLVFLVMREVNEQGFGVAIKINSASPFLPLVAAGPAWTRTLVLKAVKYGACDIMVTPSSAQDVRKKIETNLAWRAA